jgi:phosphoenolpyruvate---glycerone phosphotransferase subunit DhaL
MTDEALKRDLVTAMAEAVIAAADELTALDQAIGDGDHGFNMKRGFEAVLADVDAIAAMDWAEGCKKLGMTLVMKVGGASGPLYGTLFMELGKAWPATVDRAGLAAAFAAAIEGVRKRGKSDAGQKTMLDVLVPVQQALAGGAGDLGGAAQRAAEATIPMRAVRGRASFLGERSIGHMDPGARSSALLVAAVSDIVGE